MANRKRLVAALRVVLILCFVLAVMTEAGAERLPIKTYTTADGLPRDHINRIVQDSKGFLWFCTTEGLSRFDGYKFTNYGTEQGLASRQVTDFLETRSGTYWAATDRGLCRFNPDPLPPAGPESPPQRFVIYYPREDAAARSVNVICEDHAGTIWCGTSAGLFRLDQVGGDPVFSFVDIILPAGLEEDKLSVNAAIEDRGGSLWIIAQSGLYRRRQDGTTERYTFEEGLQEGRSSALLEDMDGRIWVGTALGLYQLVAGPKPHQSVVARRYTVKDGLSSDYVTGLCQSSDGKLWAGTGLGLCEFIPAQDRRSGRFQSYTQANGLSNPQVTTLNLDRDRNLWIGTASGGAMRLAADGFVTYDEQDGLGGDRVASILETRQGELWVVSTNTVISKLEQGRFTAAPLTLPKGVSYWGWGWYQVTLQDHTGDWWIPSFGGLVRYASLTSPEQVTRARPTAIYTTRDGLPDNSIFRLFEDSRGDIWISTLGDPKAVLTRWERATGTFRRYSPADGIPEAAPTAFCEDGSGNLWIGLYEGGLLRYRAGRFTPFTRDDGVPPGLIWGFHLDHKGRLWIATGEGGLARMDHPGAERPSFVSYTTADGLSSNQATCVTEDQWGMIYVGTGRGLNKLDPATGHIRRYTVADGLANSFINVSFRQGDGSLWFGTLRGLSRLIPQPEPPTAPPPIFITGFRVAGVPYAIPELGALTVAGPELGPNQNNVQVDFSGLNLAVAESLRYQYQLEGASSQWSAPTDLRTVSYPSLAPGSYRLLVRAVSSDGTLSEFPAAVSFSILPPLWQRSWVRLLALLLIAIPVVAIARYRYQHLKALRQADDALRKSREERLAELEMVRARIATDLHDDIGSTLSQIYLLSEVARQRVGPDHSEVAGPLAMISNASHEVVSSMSDIVWAINPQKDHLSDLIQRMRRFASDTLSARDIAFQFHAPDAGADTRLGANVRREVFMIFKESVNNLVKHSGCAAAEIEFQITDGSVLLRVSDNGKGFDAFNDSEGHGLGSMRERARGIGGQLELISTEGKGTIVTLRIQLAQPSTWSPPASNGGARAG